MASPRVSSRRRAPLQRSRQPTAAPNIFSRLFGWFQKSDPQPVHVHDDYDDDQDLSGKRRRTARPDPADNDQLMDDARQPRTKRLRREGPLRLSDPVAPPSAFGAPLSAPASSVSSGYLDPPSYMLSAPYVPSYPLPARHSALPIERTMSIDPPARYTAPPTRRDPTAVPLPLSRDQSMDISPRPLRIRSTLTPARSGLDFGPQPVRRERDPSEPPPLTALMSNPVFVKPPPREPRRISDSSSSSTTLGALAKQRSASIPRAHSMLVLPTAPDGTKLRPVNDAEIAFNHLEIYRTPLVPTRLRSALSPDVPLVEPMFQSREKAKHMIFLQNDKARKPRLGMTNRIPAIEEVVPKTTPERVERSTNAKPYAGASSMKKLLARRRKEEEEEREKRGEDGGATFTMDEYVPPPKRISKIPAAPTSAPVLSRKTSASLNEPSPIASLGTASGGRLPSTLRASRGQSLGAGRTVGPMRRKRGRFSAIDDDEEESVETPSAGLEDIEEEKAAEPVGPKYEAPAGFTFAPPTTAAPQAVPSAPPIATSKTDGPVTALPFSLTPSVTPAPAITVSAPAPPTSLAPVSAPAPVSTPAPAQAASSPFASAPVAETKATERPAEVPASVPNFFVPKPTFSPEAVTIPAPIPSPSAPVPAPAPVEAPKPSTLTPPLAFSFAPPSTQPASTAPSALPFGLAPKPAEPKPEEKKEAVPEPPKSLFGGTFTGFGLPAPAPTSASTEASKRTFTFGAPPATSAPEPTATTTPAATSAPAPEAPKPAFSGFTFGQPAPTAPAAEKEQPKPSTPSPFSFGAAPATPPAAEKKPGFTFGATPSASAPTTSGFSFGAAPTPATENKGFTFGNAAPARPATPPRADDGMKMDESPTREPQPKLQLQVPSFGFGNTNGSTTFANGNHASSGTGGGFMFGAAKTTENTSSGFTFGAQKPAESAGFSFGAKPAGGAGGFTFGAPASKPTDAPTNAFAFNAAKPAEAAPTSPFTFAPSKPAEGSSGGFSFGASKPAENTSSGFAFGASKPVETAGFTFGAPKSAEAGGGAFAFGAKPAEQGATTFGFGKADSRPSSSGFAFSQPAAAAAAPASFGQATSTPGSSPFAFGQSLPVPPATGGFGTSAPASPAFGSPAGGGFTFGAGPPSAGAQPSQPSSFAFGGTGSQPASPATGNPGAFSFSAGSGNPPASPFGAASTGGFSMGSGGVPPPGQRQMKRLPTRKVTKRHDS
ncbi:hypothetical protein K488DRAFT_87466 [Vararia minispora EC-137]|uniref:Uncharacterized protein n=1 Tax=Vararia minispora EC-137 TaxID=1314806 RepID=A0ACB8QGR2_9AGAM|nr:hypothetical protein K488DRAFT_87466 [Vararia minispora EC-137]